MDKEKAISKFKEKAALVAAFIHEAAGIQEALTITAELCRQKNSFENLMPEDQKPTKEKILAAPNLDLLDYDLLQMLCKKNDITLIKENIRKFPGGIDMGVTLVDFGIAETGTLVLNSDSEATRLATMLCEIHVAVLEKTRIREIAIEMADELKEMVKRPSSYTAFITGASRTADIERVLAIGVHGPLALHIILIPGE